MMAIQGTREDWERERLRQDVAKGNVKSTSEIRAFLGGATKAQAKLLRTPTNVGPPDFNYLFDKANTKKLSKQVNDSIRKKFQDEARKQGLKREVKSRGRDLIADVTGSTCFQALYFSAADGGVYADFANPTRGTWFIPASRDEAREWFASVSLGETFNAEFRD